MMPRTGSYGETPTVTRSPGTTLMRKRRIRPLSWASTSWPASHCTRYNPPQWTATTVPCMSIRSSLLKLLAILSVHQTNIVPYTTHKSQGSRLEGADCVFDLPGECLVIVSGQRQRFAERDTDAAWPRHLPGVMQDFVESFNPDGDHRHAEARRDHADTGTEPLDLAGVAPLAFGKDEDRKAVLEHLADVAERLPRAGFALRERTRVEEERREIIIEAVGEPRFLPVLLREEVHLEELLRHRRREAIAQACWQRDQDARRVHVALMIRREHHRTVDRGEMF